MHQFRQLATRYLQAWLGLWIIVVLAGSLTPCCESVAASEPSAEAVSAHIGGAHDHDEGSHHESGSAEHIVCDAALASADSCAAVLLASKYRFDPKPVKTLLITRGIEPAISPFDYIPLRIPVLPLLHYQPVYLATQRLRI